MKIATLKAENTEAAALVFADGMVLISALNPILKVDYPADILTILSSERWNELGDLYRVLEEGGHAELQSEIIPWQHAEFAPLYRHPRKIWGIGLNYADHAADLAETAPQGEPASFMKPDTAIIGYGDKIELPLLSHKTTGEAELGIVFQRRCRHVSRADWRSVVAGFTSVIDITAEDILRRNPRNLTQSKSFDTFFSYGPILYSVDEITRLEELEVSTVVNGAVRAKNRVGNMTFPPDFLVSYHSQVMTMLPGDIISTGTPGAAELKDGDVIEARIDGFEPLVNPVRDLKLGDETRR